MAMSLVMVINEVEKEALEEALADVHAVNVQHSAIFTVEKWILQAFHFDPYILLSFSLID